MIQTEWERQQKDTKEGRMKRGGNGGESLSVRYMLIFILLNLNILKNIKQEWHLEFRRMLIFFCCAVLPLPSRHPRAALPRAGNCCSGKQACFMWRRRNKNGRKKKQNTETFIYFPHQRRQGEVNVSDRLLKVDLSEDVQVFFCFVFFLFRDGFHAKFSSTWLWKSFFFFLNDTQGVGTRANCANCSVCLPSAAIAGLWIMIGKRQAA